MNPIRLREAARPRRRPRARVALVAGLSLALSAACSQHDPAAIPAAPDDPSMRADSAPTTTPAASAPPTPGAASSPTGAGSGAGTSAGPGGATIAPGGPASRSVLVECVEGNLVERPTSFPLGCADGASATELSWSDWGRPRAIARGTAVVNSCVPSCADGTLQRFPVELSVTTPVRRGPVQVYTRGVVRYPGAVPQGADRVSPLDLRS